MTVRPFYMDAEIDGQTTKSGGPKSKGGGMTIYIKQRDQGGIITAFRIDCESRMIDGKIILTTTVVDGYYNVVASCETEY